MVVVVVVVVFELASFAVGLLSFPAGLASGNHFTFPAGSLNQTTDDMNRRTVDICNHTIGWKNLNLNAAAADTRIKVELVIELTDSGKYLASEINQPICQFKVEVSNSSIQAIDAFSFKLTQVLFIYLRG